LGLHQAMVIGDRGRCLSHGDVLLEWLVRCE
jgi:hypothetical protein